MRKTGKSYHSFRCRYCNTRVKTAGSLCKRCSQYKGTFFKPNNKKGVQEFDCFGQPICKLCGKAFKSLGYHLHSVHDLYTDEYLDMFELPQDMSLTKK